MEAAGAVRLKDVEEAQQALVQSAKDLADRERLLSAADLATIS